MDWQQKCMLYFLFNKNNGISVIITALKRIKFFFLFNFYSMHLYLGREPLKANIDVKTVLFWNVTCQGHCDLKNEDSSKSVLKNYTFFPTEIFAFPTLYFEIRTQIYYYLISNHQKPLDWLNLCRNHLWSLFIRSSKVFVLMRNVRWPLHNPK